MLYKCSVCQKEITRNFVVYGSFTWCAKCRIKFLRKLEGAIRGVGAEVVLRELAVMNLKGIVSRMSEDDREALIKNLSE